MECGSKIIGLKDQIHQAWFALQDKRERLPGGQSALPKAEYDRILDLAGEGLQELARCHPNHILMDDIHRLIRVVKIKRDTLGRVSDGRYILPDAVASTLLIEDINKLANMIHRAGYDLLTVRGRHAGCEILADDLTSVNRGALAYCEGVLGPKAQLRSPGNVVEHRPGTAGNHAAQFSFEENEQGYDVNVEYTESGDGHWRERKQGVLDFVGSRGLSCEAGRGLGSVCKGANIPERPIKEMAIFISHLRDVDLLSKGCVQEALDHIGELVREMIEVEEPWKRSRQRMEDWAAENCEAAREEREEERAARVERLEDNIQATNNNLFDRLQALSRKPCGAAPYYTANVLKYTMDALHDDVRRYKEIEAGYQWAEDMVEVAEDVVRKAKEELVARCPVENIIDQVVRGIGETGADFDYVLGYIGKVCADIENEPCLKAIAQARERQAAGIKQLPLLSEGKP